MENSHASFLIKEFEGVADTELIETSLFKRIYRRIKSS
jgi:hypothetical protein